MHLIWLGSLYEIAEPTFNWRSLPLDLGNFLGKNVSLYEWKKVDSPGDLKKKKKKTCLKAAKKMTPEKYEMTVHNITLAGSYFILLFHYCVINYLIWLFYLFTESIFASKWTKHQFLKAERWCQISNKMWTIHYFLQYLK